jgi:uncharacterized membrane protein
VRSFAAVSLLLATMTSGLMAGVYASFSFSVMPGLGRSGDRTFIEAMQRINVAIVNGWFLLCFLGALVFSALALVLCLLAPGAGPLGRPALPWIIAGLVLYAITLVITFTFNIPLNNALDAAGPPDTIGDLLSVRAAFEARWVAWNIARAVIGVASFGSLCWALVQAGRTLH